MQNLLPLLIIFFCLNTYSNPMPLGLELNKTTNIDLTKKYKIINKEPNYWQGYIPLVNEKLSKKSASVIK